MDTCELSCEDGRWIEMAQDFAFTACVASSILTLEQSLPDFCSLRPHLKVS
jgi:hypothetical protein